MPDCGSGVVVSSWSFPRSQLHAAVARKIHLSRLFNFPKPPLCSIISTRSAISTADKTWHWMNGVSVRVENIAAHFLTGIRVSDNASVWVFADQYGVSLIRIIVDASYR
tara:strand:+ start:77 stop:403 length:327 start_codon:yes stop_codon:yes gene_type:complete